MTGIVEFLATRLRDDELVAWGGAGIIAGENYAHRENWAYDRERFMVVVDREQRADEDWPLVVADTRNSDVDGTHIARHDPARVLAEVKAKRRIVELHTTGSYRTYQCSNGDHIQEWQCERAKEPYTEDRYCEVGSGSECVELPLLAAPYDQHPDYNPAWRVE